MTVSPSTLPIETDRSFLAPEKTKSKPIPSEIISKFFKDRQVAAACALEDNFMRPNLFLRSAVGLGAGASLGGLLESTGPAVAFHEIVGHGLLGWAMTNQPGQSPSYIVEGWENFKAIGHAGSFKEGVVDFFQWISGDTHGNNFAGETIFPGPYNPNAMGQAMGPDGQEAWVSLAGSLPMLAFDTASVVGGMLLRRRSPAIGCMLVGMGLTDSIINSTYPISAAMMSPTEMQQQAQQGHDFANFAIHMSNILGVSAETVAIATAAIWTPIVPLAALIAFLHTKSHAADIVPDALAVKHWLQQAETDPKIAKDLECLLKNFPRKKEFEEFCQLVLSSEGKTLTGDKIELIQRYALGFTAYVLDRLPTASLDQAKKEVLADWEKNVVPDRLQTALTAAAIVGNTTAVATKVMGVFADTIAPSLSTAVTALTYASPIFVGASTLTAGYQVYKDFQCPDTVVPKLAKLLSVVKLIVSVVCAILITTALFIPGLNSVFFGALIIGCIVGIILSFARSRIVKRQFEQMQAMKPEIRNVMEALWLYHQKKPAGTQMGRALQTWVDCVKRDPNYQFPKTEPPLPASEKPKEKKITPVYNLRRIPRFSDQFNPKNSFQSQFSGSKANRKINPNRLRYKNG